MSFPLSEVPTTVDCPSCGVYGIEIELARGFEILTAGALRGRVAPGSNVGYDVYGSEFFPEFTFQIKHSKEHEKSGHSGWQWAERVLGAVDFSCSLWYTG